MDTVVYALLNKKIRGLVSGIQSASVSGTTITFTMNDGSKQSITFSAPKDGLSITDVDVNADNTLTCTLSDGSTVTTANKIKTIKGDDGFSPTITEDAGNTDDIYKLVIADKNGSITTPNLKGGGVLEAEIKPNVAMGSVKSEYPVGTSIEEIIRDMLTEKIAPSVTMNLNPATTLYDETKDSISSLTISAIVTKKTNDIKKIEYFVNNSLVKTNETGVAAGGTFSYIYNKTINDDVTIKIVVTDSEGMTATASKKITFIGQSYYGLVDAGTGEPSEAIVKALNKKLKDTKKYVYSGITTDWAKICYAYPAELGKLTSIMDKVNNFNYTTSFQLNTKTIDGISYYVYTLIEPTGADNVELTFE